VAGSFPIIWKLAFHGTQGIEYTSRARLGRHQWIWTICVKEAYAITNQLVGTRDEAIADAREELIYGWQGSERKIPRMGARPLD
jgi:hypothetical protein